MIEDASLREKKAICIRLFGTAMIFGVVFSAGSGPYVLWVASAYMILAMLMLALLVHFDEVERPIVASRASSEVTKGSRHPGSSRFWLQVGIWVAFCLGTGGIVISRYATFLLANGGISSSYAFAQVIKLYPGLFRTLASIGPVEFGFLTLVYMVAMSESYIPALARVVKPALTRAFKRGAG